MTDSPGFPRCFLAVFLALNVTNAFITIPPTQLQRSVLLMPRIRTKKNGSSPSSYRSWNICLSESEMADTGPKNDSTSNNEFSRTISISKWFGPGSANNRNRKKKMDLLITATPEECHALANRFRLSDITALSAELTVQPVVGGDSDTSGIDDSECIEAKGTICAHVTQSCVRTNEAFDVSLEFSFDTVLRAMTSSSGSVEEVVEPLSAGELAALDAASKLENGRTRKKKGANKAKRIKGGQSIDDMGMKQMQDILGEYEVTDEIIEDEQCFCTDGIVDCGEVVAQILRSKLDPYPKKPGSVSYLHLFCSAIVDGKMHAMYWSGM